MTPASFTLITVKENFKNDMNIRKSVWLKFFATLYLAAFLLGCQSKLTEQNYQKVQSGMTLEEVKAILGEPTTSKSSGIGPLSGTSAEWKEGELTINIQFLNNKLQLKTMNGSK